MILLAFIYSFSHGLLAKEYSVSVTDDLQQVLDDSKDGDILTLSVGRYLGNFVVTKKVTIRGENEGNRKAIIDAQGQGHAFILKNSHITIDNLTIVIGVTISPNKTQVSIQMKK